MCLYFWKIFRFNLDRRWLFWLFLSQKLNLHEWRLVTLTNPPESVIFLYAARTVLLATMFLSLTVNLSCHVIFPSSLGDGMLLGEWVMGLSCVFCFRSFHPIQHRRSYLLFHLWYHRINHLTRLEISLENIDLLNLVDLNLSEHALSSLNRALWTQILVAVELHHGGLPMVLAKAQRLRLEELPESN